jgi:hypothetical protein
MYRLFIVRLLSDCSIWLLSMQAGADLVWCNDHDPRNNLALVYNLVNALPGHGTSNSNDATAESSSSSSSSSSGVVAQAEQWLSAAEKLHYPGLRGNILQWSSSSSSTACSLHNNDSSQPQTVPQSESPHKRRRIEEQQQQQQCRVTHVEASR